jgi:CheY-like chemotaxis protein
MLGAQVEVAHDGASALSVLDRFHPRVVLLDIGMPGMDGYEVARRMRRHPGGGALSIVALSGWGQDDDRARSRAAGFDHHLVKPVEIHALHALMASIDSPPAASRRA